MLRYQHEATSNHNKTCQTGLTHIQSYEDTVDVGVYRDFKHDLNASYVHLHKETNDANSLPLTERQTQHCPPRRNPSSQDPPSEEATWEVCVDMRDFMRDTGPFFD